MFDINVIGVLKEKTNGKEKETLEEQLKRKWQGLH